MEIAPTFISVVHISIEVEIPHQNPIKIIQNVAVQFQLIPFALINFTDFPFVFASDSLCIN
jgi:hypothetical protein